MGKAEVGRIFGIPVVLDVSFILLIVLYGMHHFNAANLASISYGVVLVAGVAFSILLHELGHALAGRYWKVPTAYVELNGLGGLCHFARPFPPDRIKNITMLLAGPAANLLLWQVFEYASDAVFTFGGENPDRLAFLLKELARINLLLLIFNLMPAHPLDGGRTLAHLLSKAVGYDRAMRFVAYLGLLVAVWLALLAFSGQFFAALIAFVLFQANVEILHTHGGPRWNRWN